MATLIFLVCVFLIHTSQQFSTDTKGQKNVYFEREATEFTYNDDSGQVQVTVKAHGNPIPNIRCHANDRSGRSVKGMNIYGPASSDFVFHVVSYHANSRYIQSLHFEALNTAGEMDRIVVDTSAPYGQK